MEAELNDKNAETSRSPARTSQDSRRVLVVQAVLITLIIWGTVWRVMRPFAYNPLDFLFSDPNRHYSNAFTVHGENLESILNNPGFELFLSTVLRITDDNKFLVALVMASLSAATPWLWYRWLRELTRDKTISLFGYALFTYLPSYFRIFSFFMDTVILLPLTGAALWLSWRAARKGSLRSCVLAAAFCGAACCTKSVAVPVVVLPWVYIGYRLLQKAPRAVALRRTAAGLLIMACFYGLGPLKVWAHTGALVLMPDGIYNQRYFESGAHDIIVKSSYHRTSGGDYVEVCVWGSSSVCYPPFHGLPFIGDWMPDRYGRYSVDLDYRHGRDYAAPIYMSWQNRLKYTFENILLFFFEYQWPEDQDWQAPFPGNLPTVTRFIWFPLTIFILGYTLLKRKRDFMLSYFIALTLIYMLQQSAVMEGRYKKLWEGVALGALIYVIADSKRYKAWRDTASSAG